ncbi:PEP-CTERM sorting domain-containing protein [Massilia sp. G4R7]|uniref:PEP-CTERM sorting domain-containing protein n=1 Tax=Massilia phyllostachyos TaxID=2898585 RepID=A0ABS8QA75_9BURK|nr:PEP-CTERM sorting domain-containing protein [Massilia phyllostachyos]MCD2518463.1 PEP-CTERM sorting domain-containing protein [Massilia phyllostachyos]
MKKFVNNLLLAGAPLVMLIGNAAADTCGGRFGPCEVPEPSTPALFLGAIGVAIAVAKFRKKK